jgi:hypothetical protein
VKAICIGGPLSGQTRRNPDVLNFPFGHYRIVLSGWAGTHSRWSILDWTQVFAVWFPA